MIGEKGDFSYNYNINSNNSNYQDDDKFSEFGGDPKNKPYIQKIGRNNIYRNRYNDTSKRFRGFWYLMLQWKGSVFKLIWHDFLLFVLAYSFLALLYRVVLDKDEVASEMFEIICVFCSRFRGYIPITFLTGFYVSEVVRRYWDQFMNLPFPDRLALKLVSYVPGKDNFRRTLRRTVMRYVNLSTVLVFRLVSEKVRKRFPDYESLVKAKLMLPAEVERMRKAESETPHEATWTPVLWALKLLERARTEGKIKIEAPIFANLVDSFEYLEINNRKVLNYGWVNFPLAYTQVATISVYAYLLAALFAAQFLEPPPELRNMDAFPELNITFATDDPYDEHTPNFGFPIFTFVEFIGYLGWIKVAETLLNPFGDDDEDFEINYLIDRNVQVSYMIVDDADMEMEMAKDPFLEAGIAIPAELPYQDVKQREESARKVVGVPEAAATPNLRTRIKRQVSNAMQFNRNSANLESFGKADNRIYQNHNPEQNPRPRQRGNSIGDIGYHSAETMMAVNNLFHRSISVNDDKSSNGIYENFPSISELNKTDELQFDSGNSSGQDADSVISISPDDTVSSISEIVDKARNNPDDLRSIAMVRNHQLHTEKLKELKKFALGSESPVVTESRTENPRKGSLKRNRDKSGNSGHPGRKLGRNISFSEVIIEDENESGHV